jgi:hypothetical protein
MNNKIKILICTHKHFNYIADDSFLPIHVGKEISNLTLPYQPDNEGKNISSKNKNYCELTALYWAWKNLEKTEYIGLCHYRRFFDFEKSKTFNTLEEINEDYFTSNFSNYIFQEQIMNDFDIILSKPLIKTRSLFSHYSKSHHNEDFDILQQTINELFPDYSNSFHKIMNGNNELSPFNMFIAKNEFLSDYSTWLFTILEEVEKRISISQNPYQERVLGFMAERLLNVYVFHNNLKVNYLPVHFISDKNKTKHLLLNNLTYITNKIIFYFRKKIVPN